MGELRRDLYAAIGRGEMVEFSCDRTSGMWIQWDPVSAWRLGSSDAQWRIKPQTVMVELPKSARLGSRAAWISSDGSTLSNPLSVVVVYFESQSDADAFICGAKEKLGQ